MSKTETPPSTCSFVNSTKKIKLTDFACKCEKYFCKFHKDPLNHNCSYDYKETNKKQKKIDDLICKAVKVQKL